jgi:PII-like signaling protein
MVKTHSLGKLRIYITPADKIKHKGSSAWRRLFPKSAYIHIIEDARKEGIMNATAYNTHFGFSNKGKIVAHHSESGNANLNVCVELVDKREKLEAFFLRHKDYLKGKVVIYKEAEFWDAD